MSRRFWQLGRSGALALLVSGAVAMSGCGNDAPPEPPPPAAKPKPAAPPSSAVAPLAKGEVKKESVLEQIRQRTLTNDDFVESDTNRDPFRSFLTTFAAQPVLNKQHKIVLEKFALDELKLAGIVGGEGTSPKAMFIDPSGFGTWIVRGDHLSKADATVNRIAPDRVFFQIEEDAGGGKTRAVERVIELHQGEGVTQ